MVYHAFMQVVIALQQLSQWVLCYVAKRHTMFEKRNDGLELRFRTGLQTYKYACL